MTKPDNPMAFPSGEKYTTWNDMTATQRENSKAPFHAGMTLRDYFISQVQVPNDLSRAWGEAVVGSYPKQPDSDIDLPFGIEVAKWWANVSAAYRCMEADAMLKARE